MSQQCLEELKKDRQVKLAWEEVKSFLENGVKKYHLSEKEKELLLGPFLECLIKFQSAMAKGKHPNGDELYSVVEIAEREGVPRLIITDSLKLIKEILPASYQSKRR